MRMTNLEQWRAVWFQAVARAWGDANFRNELMADARGTLTTHFDCQIPGEVGLQVIDGDGDPDVRVDRVSSTALFGNIELRLPPRPEGMSFHSLDTRDAIELNPGPCICCPC